MSGCHKAGDRDMNDVVDPEQARGGLGDRPQRVAVREAKEPSRPLTSETRREDGRMTTTLRSGSDSPHVIGPCFEAIFLT